MPRPDRFDSTFAVRTQILVRLPSRARSRVRRPVVGRLLAASCIGLLAVASVSGCALPGPQDDARRISGARVETLSESLPESVGLSSESLSRLDRVMEGYVDRGQLPGYQLLVSRRGQIVHESVYGQLDREAGTPLRSDTIYRIYSMSKVVTGVATMIAYEQGSFLLNDLVSKYLPALSNLRVMEWDENGDTWTVPAEREITILDLLRHTSGFSYHFSARPPLAQQYVDSAIAPGLRPMPESTPLDTTNFDPTQTLEEMVERLGQVPLAVQPGTEWHYGISMDVLGRLIEVVSGQSFPEFLAEHLFAPLGMQDTAFYVPPEKADRFAALYAATPEGGLRLVDPPGTSAYLEVPALPGGGGGLVSTAADYMRFAQMLTNRGEFEGRRILSPRVAELMMSNHLPASLFGVSPLTYPRGGVYANDGLGVGFGLTGSVITDAAATGLPISPGTFSWGGAASTVFWADPQEEIAVVFMTQMLISNTYPLRAHLLKGVNSALLD